MLHVALMHKYMTGENYLGQVKFENGLVWHKTMLFEKILTERPTILVARVLLPHQAAMVLPHLAFRV